MSSKGAGGGGGFGGKSRIMSLMNKILLEAYIKILLLEQTHANDYDNAIESY